MDEQTVPPTYANQISLEQYDREAETYTAMMVESLNKSVRGKPSLGAKSHYFKFPENVKRGLPVFQGKHTRFVYDDSDEEIIDIIDVTNEPKSGPHVRTVAELSDYSEEENEDDEYEQSEVEDDIDEDSSLNMLHDEDINVPSNQEIDNFMHDISKDLNSVTISDANDVANKLTTTDMEY